MLVGIFIVDTVTNSAGVPEGSQGSIIFLETMKDVGGVRYDTAPHEIGHQFGLKGDVPNLGIMSYGTDTFFVPQHLNVFRWRIKSPGQP